MLFLPSAFPLWRRHFASLRSTRWPSTSSCQTCAGPRAGCQYCAYGAVSSPAASCPPCDQVEKTGGGSGKGQGNVGLSWSAYDHPARGVDVGHRTAVVAAVERIRHRHRRCQGKGSEQRNRADHKGRDSRAALSSLLVRRELAALLTDAARYLVDCSVRRDHPGGLQLDDPVVEDPAVLGTGGHEDVLVDEASVGLHWTGATPGALRRLIAPKASKSSKMPPLMRWSGFCSDMRSS